MQLKRWKSLEDKSEGNGGKEKERMNGIGKAEERQTKGRCRSQTKIRSFQIHRRRENGENKAIALQVACGLED